MKFILGKKVGMTSVINEDGDFIPVTVVSAGPCFVTQLKNKEKDGYDSVQIGFDEKKKLKKPLSGHLKKAGKKLRYVRECRTEDREKELKVGDTVDVSVFEKGDKVKVTGNIKAKGFSGAIKRWGFKSQPSSHGHPEQRRVGAIGACSFPGKVFKGKKMPGRKGPEKKTIINLEVFDVDKENNLILVKGSIPGVRGRLVEIRG